MESTQLSQPVPTPATHAHRLIPVVGWPDSRERFDLELEGFGIIARIVGSDQTWVVCSEEMSIHAFHTPQNAAAFFLNEWQAKVEQYHLDNWLD